VSVAIGVIPARWASTRFPGKSLAMLGGKPLIQHVVERVRKARRLSGVIVATDDDRIAAVGKQLGVNVVMTRTDHPSGTDRIAEAVAGHPADVVVNIQGDEPFIEPVLIDRLCELMSGESDWDMATAATPITREEERDDASVVKVVWDHRGRALYFSRALIPHIRDRDMSPDGLHFRHLGVYAYRRDFLFRMVAAPQSATERAEKLEQLRALHVGASICVVETKDYGIGVDTPADLQYAESLLQQGH
jgi:3-deoxy-manno-octulosonate cytidylyltransferase (CMP-KDO synthetase)